MDYGPNKVCSLCGKCRLLKFFVLSAKGYRHSYCKKCSKKEYRKWADKNAARLAQYAIDTAKRNRALVEGLKARPCADCGVPYPPCVMDFDHLPQFKKRSAISNMMSSKFSEKAILAEAAKCEVVCSNCHRIRTAARSHQGRQERLRIANGG
jgi:hypothetical protein